MSRILLILLYEIVLQLFCLPLLQSAAQTVILYNKCPDHNHSYIFLSQNAVQL